MFLQHQNFYRSTVYPNFEQLNLVYVQIQVVKIIKNMCIFLYMLKDYCCLIVFMLIYNVFVQVHVQLLFHRFFMVFNSWCSHYKHWINLFCTKSCLFNFNVAVVGDCFQKSFPRCIQPFSCHD